MSDEEYPYVHYLLRDAAYTSKDDYEKSGIVLAEALEHDEEKVYEFVREWLGRADHDLANCRVKVFVYPALDPDDSTERTVRFMEALKRDYV